MKNILQALLLGIVCCSCIMQTSKTSLENDDYVTDTTLCLDHLEVGSNDAPIDSNKSEVLLPIHVIDLIKPEIDYWVEKQEICSQFTIHVNLVNDSVWIARGTFTPEKNEVIFGGVVYIEIRKKDGHILKRVIEE